MCTIFTTGYCAYAEEDGFSGCKDCPYSEPEKEEMMYKLEEKKDDREN